MNGFAKKLNQTKLTVSTSQLEKHEEFDIANTIALMDILFR